MLHTIIFAAALAASAVSPGDGSGVRELTFTADRIAVDNVTRAAVATGHVVATSSPYSLRGERLEKRADGTFLFSDPTAVTTCTNDVGHTHWNVTGELEYRSHDAVVVRDAWLRLWEIPVLWMPYMYYPLETDCGFSWMPGYVGRWGAYLMTKTRYHLLGDPSCAEESWWMHGATRLDLRYKNGIAVGEDLKWGLGAFGTGKFSTYYAWDEDADDRYRVKSDWNSGNWGSSVKKQRYIFTAEHRWEATERDVVRMRGSYLSDSYFRRDFLRKSMFNLKNQWRTYRNSGVFWEHLEDSFSAGVEASGRLNDFYEMTGRLPEVYFDVNPTPVFGLPFNYESQSRLGYLTRDFADYGAGRSSVFGTRPGLWAKYESFRFDTYHRVTAPFRTLGDVLSVVPRVGWRGTWWNETGETDVAGRSRASNAGAAFRSIGEFGATFAARGAGELGDGWRHLTEPYLDVLAQEAWYDGRRSGSRPYVFDSIDASMTWEDQFAGRARCLPYSYYGVTPGWRNVWSVEDDKGAISQSFDLDVYVAAQFNSPDRTAGGSGHRLSRPGDPNYGSSGGAFMPGVRLVWRPSADLAAGVRAEYDSDENDFAYASAFLRHDYSKSFSWRVSYDLRDHRLWDFSSAPYDGGSMEEDAQNLARYQMLDVSATHQVCDWLAWGPHVRWDLREGELDTAGFWIDYLTDCLGFRFIVEYDNEYTLIDGSRMDDDWTFGFYVYLRAIGADSDSVFVK